MEPSKPQPPSRRDFLGKAFLTSGCAGCAFAAVPVVNYLIPRPSPLPQGPKDVAGAEEIPEGGSKTVRIGPLSVLIIRSGGRLTAVNAKCTHLGGIVKWDAPSSQIRCPIHGAVFRPDGTEPTKPAPRPLPSFPVRAEGGRIIVTF